MLKTDIISDLKRYGLPVHEDAARGELSDAAAALAAKTAKPAAGGKHVTPEVLEMCRKAGWPVGDSA
jgi:hypothetical protein